MSGSQVLDFFNCAFFPPIFKKWKKSQPFYANVLLMFSCQLITSDRYVRLRICIFSQQSGANLPSTAIEIVMFPKRYEVWGFWKAVGFLEKKHDFFEKHSK